MGGRGASVPPSSSAIKIEKSMHTKQKENYFEIVNLALVFWFWNNLLNVIVIMHSI